MLLRRDDFEKFNTDIDFDLKEYFNRTNLFITLFVVCICLARGTESLRDAIDFNKGALQMGILWHYLKIPQFSFLLLGGFLLKYITWVDRLIALFVGTICSYLVFEKLLDYFRTIPWQDYPWANLL